MAACTHYEVSYDGKFAEAFAEALFKGYRYSHEVFRFALENDHYATQGMEHPWKTGGNFPIFWAPGKTYWRHPHVVAGDREGEWAPAPGYRWIDPDDSDDFRVVWAPGKTHSRHPHVVAGDREGEWAAAPGYRWVNPHGNGDLRVVWTPGSRHPRNPSAVAGAKPGQWTSSYFVTRRGARGSG